jgi:DNA (cytosine-5)-methyltransferase 1
LEKSTFRELKAVDFFCGAGGVTCGFNGIGIKVIGGIDIDPKFKDTYEMNNSGALFLNKDVSNFNPSDLQPLLDITQNDDDLIFVGCSPCQYFSNLKSDKSKSKSGRLLLEDFKEFVLYYKPGFVFIENVPGLETKKGSPLHKFKATLKKEGYVFEQKVLNAKDFDVPQKRRRFILIASRVLTKIELPKVTKKNKIVTVKDAIGNYTKFPKVSDGSKDMTDFQHSVAKLSDLNLRRVKKTPKNGGSRKAWEKDNELQLECYKTHDGHYDVYGRLFWNKPSPTITTRFIYTSTGRYSHPEQNRALSLREGATLQSFPLTYKFHSTSPGIIATMIGNAVPPKLAEAIGKSILNQWNKWRLLKPEQGL